MKSFLLLCSLCLLSLPCFNLFAEVIQLKNGTSIEGEAQEIKEDLVILKRPNGMMSIFFKDMAPVSVYEMRSRSIKQDDPQAHLALAEYCLTHTLYTAARKEYEQAARLDENLKEIVTQRIETIIERESGEVLIQVYNLIKDEKYDLALDQLQKLLQKYPEGKHVTEANKVMTFVVEAAKHKAEEAVRRKEMLAQQKEKEQRERVEQALHDKFTEALNLVERARKLNTEGLDWETKLQTSRADKAYKEAETALLEAQRISDEVVKQTQDVELMTAAKKHLEEITKWLIIIYNNLGQLWTYELNFREALKWLNHTLALDPHNQVASELKLKIIDIEARRRALGQDQK